MSKELDGWKATLPPSLQIDLSAAKKGEGQPKPSVVVIQLHMQYHGIMILLNRPFVGDVASRENMNDMNLDACRVCSRSAAAISELLRMFRRQLSWRYVHLQSVHNTTIAGVIHVYDSITFPGERGKQAQEGLNVCVQALAEMGQSFQSSMRGYEVIAAIRRESQAKRWLQTGAKRARGLVSQPVR